MKKTWNIGERCRYGTIKILKVSEESITIGLTHYKEKEIQEEKTFTEHFEMWAWLENQCDSYHTDLIIDELKKNGYKLKEGSMW